MKASDIQVGDLVDGWTVQMVAHEGNAVLLRLDLPPYGDEGLVVHPQKRNWYREGEEVEVER